MRVDWVGGFWGTLSGAVVSETDDVGCLHCFFFLFNRWNSTNFCTRVDEKIISLVCCVCV